MSERKDNGGPAFPASSWTKDGDFIGDNQGMTLRDYFAAQAMSLMNWQHGDPKHNAKCAEQTYAIADAMLKARQP